MKFVDSCVSTLHSWYTGYSLPNIKEGKPTHTIKGKIVYHEDEKPAAFVKVNCFVEGWFSRTHIGSATTTKTGAFSLKVHSASNTQKVIIQVVEKRRPFAQEDLACLKEEVVIQQFEKTLDLSDLGKLELTVTDSPKDITVIRPPLKSHIQSPAFFWKFFEAVRTEAPKRLFVSLARPLLSASSVQWIYNLFGPSYEKRPLTKENLIEELLNHVTAVGGKDQGNKVMWEANWDGIELKRDDTLPNVIVRAIKKPDDTLELEKIELKFRNDEFVYHVRPNDRFFDRALYMARSVFALKGEAEFHLARGHILPGIIAEEFDRFMKRNPLYKKLEPHLSQLDTINWIGSKGVIFGPGSVLTHSALTVDSVAKIIVNEVKKAANWKDYAPPTPLAKDHYLADAEKVHFDILYTYFLTVIQKNKSAIRKDWSSIYNWSEAVNEHLPEIPKITTTKKPRQEDYESLAKFCAWAVSKTTFLHWAAHSRQQILTDIRQASLAPQTGAFTLESEMDPYGKTEVDDANVQLFVSRVLLNFKGDSLLENPYGDVDPDLIEAIKTHIPDYKGYADIQKMFITTQI